MDNEATVVNRGRWDGHERRECALELHYCPNIEKLQMGCAAQKTKCEEEFKTRVPMWAFKTLLGVVILLIGGYLVSVESSHQMMKRVENKLNQQAMYMAVFGERQAGLLRAFGVPAPPLPSLPKGDSD